MKVAPILRAIGPRADVRLVHAEQHTGEAMSESFLSAHDLPRPSVRLGPLPRDPVQMTAAVMLGIQQELEHHPPSALIVPGDVTSTLAAALAARKLSVPIAHVEAGLRSRDWSMPEECNRIVTDAVSDLLLAPSRDAMDNLRQEKLAERAAFVGNVMVDSLHFTMQKPASILERLAPSPPFVLLTVHRPSNVDDPLALGEAFSIARDLSLLATTVFPCHPRTLDRAKSLGLPLPEGERLILAPPLDHADFVTLMRYAAVVVTDSGGVQEETTALGVPCLTMRDNTERPITVTEGTNMLVGRDRSRVLAETRRALSGHGKRGRIPEGWDGRAGERSAEAILELASGARPKLVA